MHLSKFSLSCISPLYTTKFNFLNLLIKSNLFNTLNSCPFKTQTNSQIDTTKTQTTPHQEPSAMASNDQENQNSTNPALEPDLDAPAEPNLELAQFAAGCFWGVELTFQRVEGVVKTEVGYSQGHLHDPDYKVVCSGSTNHAEVIRIHFDPSVCPYTTLLDVFWGKHDPTTLNRQGNDVGTQYRSGIYYYNETQAKLARESLEAKQKEVGSKKIVTEILPAKTFYRAEEYHQQYLEKGGRNGSKQSAAKGCNDPIRCYG